MTTTDNNTVRLWEISCGLKMATILHDGQSLMIFERLAWYAKSDINAERLDYGPIVALAVSCCYLTDNLLGLSCFASPGIVSKMISISSRRHL